MNEIENNSCDTINFTPEEKTRILYDMEREYKYIQSQEELFNSF